jgi:hypothetical protein
MYHSIETTCYMRFLTHLGRLCQRYPLRHRSLSFQMLERIAVFTVIAGSWSLPSILGNHFRIDRLGGRIHPLDQHCL